jgi:hypothetical protein
MSINFQEILKELEYRVEHGIIDLTKEEQVTKLVEILRENGVSDANEMAQKARVYYSYLNEDEVVKNKKTGNIYVVKNFDSKKHDKPTPKEIEKAKAANGGKLPTSDTPSTGKPAAAVGAQKTAPAANIGVTGAEIFYFFISATPCMIYFIRIFASFSGKKPPPLKCLKLNRSPPLQYSIAR